MLFRVLSNCDCETRATLKIGWFVKHLLRCLIAIRVPKAQIAITALRAIVLLVLAINDKTGPERAGRDRQPGTLASQSESPCFPQYSFSDRSMGFGLRNRQTPTSTTSAANAIAINAMVIFVDPLFVAQNSSERLIAHRLSAHCEKHNGCQTGLSW